MNIAIFKKNPPLANAVSAVSSVTGLLSFPSPSLCVGYSTFVLCRSALQVCMKLSAVISRHLLVLLLITADPYKGKGNMREDEGL